jgi:hypothetical protein
MSKHDTLLTPGRADDEATQVRVVRRDGTAVAVTLRLLRYDGCEFECRERFAVGELIGIRVYRMGLIRARVLSRRRRTVEAEFVKDCPV